jgi:hypothetical protein
LGGDPGPPPFSGPGGEISQKFPPATPNFRVRPENPVRKKGSNFAPPCKTLGRPHVRQESSNCTFLALAGLRGTCRIKKWSIGGKFPPPGAGPGARPGPGPGPGPAPGPAQAQILGPPQDLGLGGENPDFPLPSPLLRFFGRRPVFRNPAGSEGVPPRSSPPANSGSKTAHLSFSNDFHTF